MTEQRAFQEHHGGHLCWGCGHLNEKGLQLKSYWGDGDEAVATWIPSPEHAAGPPHVLNGGIIATLLDCHGVSTAMADAYRHQQRPMDSDPALWFVTADLQVRYLRPTPIDRPVTLRARIVERTQKRSFAECSLSSGDKERATARVEAALVTGTWTG